MWHWILSPWGIRAKPMQPQGTHHSAGTDTVSGVTSSSPLTQETQMAAACNTVLRIRRLDLHSFWIAAGEGRKETGTTGHSVSIWTMNTHWVKLNGRLRTECQFIWLSVLNPDQYIHSLLWYPKPWVNNLHTKDQTWPATYFCKYLTRMWSCRFIYVIYWHLHAIMTQPSSYSRDRVEPKNNMCTIWSTSHLNKIKAVQNNLKEMNLTQVFLINGGNCPTLSFSAQMEFHFLSLRTPF